jgi:hypothetical protein
MRCVGHVASVGTRKGARRKNYLEVLDVDGRIILKWIFRWNCGIWTGLV